MIISASRRTDIPAYYSQWFMNRLEAGFVYVRNPMNFHQVSSISLSQEVVDGIVFWTKNPVPMLDKLRLLDGYMYYFQFTLNAYGRDIEPGIPSKNDTLIPAFRKLSDMLGPERVIWRYDPILLTEKYTLDYHAACFERLAKRLSGYTQRCVISFLDLYRNTLGNLRDHALLPLGTGEMLELARRFSDTAGKYRIRLETCAEGLDLERFGIAHGRCIDPALFEKLLGCGLDSAKDKNQRAECGCMSSVDIGMYDTCPGGCRYCYANHSPKTLERFRALRDPASPLLCGAPGPDDVVRDRAAKSLRRGQMGLF